MSAPEPVYVFRARVIRWVDGDTVDLTVATPFHSALGNDDAPARFRLYGINAWERNKPGGKEATEYVNRLAPPGSRVTIKSYKPDTPDDFGRWLCQVWDGAGFLINEGLVENGHAIYKDYR